MAATPGADVTPTANGFWDTLWASSNGESLLRHAITPRKLGVGVTHQMTSNSCVGEGLPVGWLSSLIIWFEGFKPPFLPSCRTSVLDPLMDGGSVQQPPQVERGVIPAPNQGT